MKSGKRRNSPAGAAPHRGAGGRAVAGKAFEPRALPQEEKTRSFDPVRAPAPGVPMPAEQYEELKRTATTRRARVSRHAQEDTSEEE